ncbi:hypothetical protein PHYSODRAFT_477473 [Phytophthora sojae]|uniref:DUF7869 domain-containing protein n=1 Tax=Phytophthora sojae (strain P6497) TaxID=1094619 RepID=G4YF92_PHYSP|nr:hypothetical protein PHYSODRAFT_477473 [Phytophthora sojae]EGZ27996.1 hypothetical protein PHYSODRAFT_477473 [Phytophthora sojae]|eukprot:XP_009515271.1 hypothetical protein PHYSODRAFT_477473 [Phytophthora sojae]
MLHHFIRTVLVPAGKKRLVVYADNCSGQNKNNLVIKVLLAQVHMGVFERIDFKFFVKGHTKNSCDRGFGHIRKYVSRQDLWTMGRIVDAVNDSASSNATVHISRGDDFFYSYKPLVSELYKTLVGVEQFQIFSMDASKPGLVQCKKDSDSDAEEQDLRRKIDGVLTEGTKVERMFTQFLEALPLPPINPEKVYTMNQTVRKYVPEEFRSDVMYAAPSKKQGEDAKTAKQARREHRAAMAAAAKENCDRRGRDTTAAKKQKTSCNSPDA